MTKSAKDEKNRRQREQKTKRANDKEGMTKRQKA